MPDAHFRHHGDSDGVDDPVDHVRVAHARDATVRANIRRNAFQRHDRNCPGIFGNFRLFRGNDVHDDAAFEHLCQAALQGDGASFAVVSVVVHAGFSRKSFTFVMPA